MAGADDTAKGFGRLWSAATGACVPAHGAAPLACHRLARRTPYPSLLGHRSQFTRLYSDPVLPQERLITRVQELCHEDERLVAALTYGSFIHGEADGHSDIEF